LQIQLVRFFSIVEDRHVDMGRPTSAPLRKAAVVAVIENPYAGCYVEDLGEMIAASADLGRQMAKAAIAAMAPFDIQSYGKGGIVGTAGEQEHANALLTTVFADPFREAIGGGDAWISSMTKVAPAGSLIDIPMNSKDDVYVRSHYDGMSIVLPGAPLPNEIALVFCLANRGRLNARVGGLSYEDARRRKSERS
jgi:Amino acid synthesis